MNPETQFLIIGLSLFLIPIIILAPGWIKEVKKLGQSGDSVK